MRVRAGVAPRVASGDRAASKGKSAGGCSSFKRRVEREHRCAAPHARIFSERSSHFPTRWWGYVAVISTRRPESPQPAPIMQMPDLLGSDRPWCVCACAQVGWAPFLGWKVG
eukprot:COSAG01_NODE_6720_length_3524_cov_197.457859_3_plen_112_part_00